MRKEDNLDLKVLLDLSKYVHKPQKWFVEKYGVNPGTISKLLRSLEKDGIIGRLLGHTIKGKYYAGNFPVLIEDTKIFGDVFDRFVGSDLMLNFSMSKYCQKHIEDLYDELMKSVPDSDLGDPGGIVSQILVEYKEALKVSPTAQYCLIHSEDINKRIDDLRENRSADECVKEDNYQRRILLPMLLGCIKASFSPNVPEKEIDEEIASVDTKILYFISQQKFWDVLKDIGNLIGKLSPPLEKKMDLSMNIRFKDKVFSMFEEGKNPIDLVMEEICGMETAKSLWLEYHSKERGEMNNK
jgi:hypothetical protein